MVKQKVTQVIAFAAIITVLLLLLIVTVEQKEQQIKSVPINTYSKESCITNEETSNIINSDNIMRIVSPTYTVPEANVNIDTIYLNDYHIIVAEDEDDIAAIENTEVIEDIEEIETNILTIKTEVYSDAIVELEPEEIEAITSIPKLNSYKYYNITLSDELQEFVQEACSYYKIDHKLILALMGVESEYDINAYNKKTKDYGLMQINKYNHKWLTEDLGITDFMDPKQSILCGVYMLYIIHTDYGYYDYDDMLMIYAKGYVGAKENYWDKGIYSISHTEKVLERINNLKERG